MTSYIKIFFIILILQIPTLELCKSQTKSENNFENKFFVLDFEKNDYQFSDLEKLFFTTFPHNDPTLGDVIYDRVKWINNDLFKVSKNDALYCYIKSRDDDQGFDSFRLTSKPYYNLTDDIKKILFVFKGKLPSEKGMWPAWWLNGSKQKDWLYKNIDDISDEMLDKYSGMGEFYNTPSPVNCTDWPSAGEIDIIETINGNNIIHNTIHTCPEMCNSEWNNDGILINCANATPTDPNSGCSGKSYKVDSPEGTFACIWEKDYISFYYWEPDIDTRADGFPLSENPDPKLWNKSNLKNIVKLSESYTECNIAEHQEWQCNTCKGFQKCDFKNLKIIFNITLCGSWAGNNFNKTDKALINCKEYIFIEGRNLINNQYLKIQYLSARKLQ